MIRIDIMHTRIGQLQITRHSVTDIFELWSKCKGSKDSPKSLNKTRLASTVSIYIVYYRDWRRSIGSVLKILFFYWCMALRPKYAELKL